jgi:hypothetical protein
MTKGALSFGKGYIKSNIFLNGGPCFRLGMRDFVSFGKTVDREGSFEHCLP